MANVLLEQSQFNIYHLSSFKWKAEVYLDALADVVEAARLT